MAGAQADDEIRRWLLDPGVYPHRPQVVEEIETHISHVFLAGQYVYKLKKPVRYDFLDFSTVGRRELACREELRLNRRLAPDTYLDIVAISRQPDGGLAWGSGGQVIDWVVRMRRLPTQRTLDALYARGKLTPSLINQLLQVLFKFYRGEPSVAISRQAYRERYAEHVRGNLRELLALRHHLPQPTVRRVHDFELQLLQLRPAIFDERVDAGKIIDGHGDLRPEHICFDDKINIFDCIEFNAEFRQVDVVDELAFFVSECDFLGAEWIGPLVWQGYANESDDRPPPALVDFYFSYRACVRAKVAALRADQLTASAAEAAIAEAQRHLALAEGYCRRWSTPLLIVVGGLSGSGKTTLATALAEALGAELLRTDLVRKALFGHHQHDAAADQGIYSPASRERVYQEVFRRVGILQDEGVSVVLDGTFATPSAISDARQAAIRPQTFLAIQCVCRPEVACERIARRRLAGSDASDARVATYHLQSSRWEDWEPTIPQVRIDTEQALEMQLRQTIEAIAGSVQLRVDKTPG